MTTGPGGPTEEPLDLRAIEKQHVPGNGKGVVAALLAHTRALRAALQFVFTARNDVTGELFPEAWERAAAVLAQAVDSDV